MKKIILCLFILTTCMPSKTLGMDIGRAAEGFFPEGSLNFGLKNTIGIVVSLGTLPFKNAINYVDAKTLPIQNAASYLGSSNYLRELIVGSVLTLLFNPSSKLPSIKIPYFIKRLLVPKQMRKQLDFEKKMEPIIQCIKFSKKYDKHDESLENLKEFLFAIQKYKNKKQAIKMIPVEKEKRTALLEELKKEDPRKPLEDLINQK